MEKNTTSERNEMSSKKCEEAGTPLWSMIWKGILQLKQSPQKIWGYRKKTERSIAEKVPHLLASLDSTHPHPHPHLHEIKVIC